MKLIDKILISLYLHFTKMKDEGRQVVPWFSTCVAVSFFVAISGTLVLKLILGADLTEKKIPEFIFLAAFFFVGVLCFFIIKNYLFTSEKHINLSEIYISTYSTQERLFYKICAISVLLIVPFVLGFLVWLTAKPI